MHEIMKGMNPKTVYVAGPRFWWRGTLVDWTNRTNNHSNRVQHLSTASRQPRKDFRYCANIFENNRDAIRTSDLVVANLNGITTDDGTAWELGYAAALQKPAIGIFTDWRKRFEGEEVVNLMISRSLDIIVQSLDELVSVLREYREQSK